MSLSRLSQLGANFPTSTKKPVTLAPPQSGRALVDISRCASAASASTSVRSPPLQTRLSPTSSRRGITHRRSVIASASSDAFPFPFNENQYHRVQFLEEPYGPLKIYQDPSNNVQFTGVMVFKRSTDAALTDKTKILEVFVAGDTAVNIFTLINNQKLERPMVHDVMFSIMQQAQLEDSRRWGLLRVAIVGLQNDVFVGRLFFGDPLTGRVHWDCDCRPSDGVFLSIKCNAPLYVHESVWDSAAKLLRESTVHQMLQESAAMDPQQQLHEWPQQPQQPSSSQQQHASAAVAAASGDSKQQSASASDYLVLMEDDMEDIKLLKRKLAVAVSEEDYPAAARIRDHPYMKLYKDLFSNRLLGHKAHAARVELELRQQIEGNALKQEPRF